MGENTLIMTPEQQGKLVGVLDELLETIRKIRVYDDSIFALEYERNAAAWLAYMENHAGAGEVCSLAESIREQRDLHALAGITSGSELEPLRFELESRFLSLASKYLGREL